jgi:Holliday junction resolvasome RuvABC DNA-binding subunit
MEKKAGMYRLDEKGPNVVRNDAVCALLSLGFGQKESREAVDAVMHSMKSPALQDIIKSALIQLKEK